MNIQNTEATASNAPPALRKLEDTGLQPVMMRDIMLKTLFRKSVETVTEISAAVCLPSTLVTMLIDQLRDMNLLQATGTLHANSGGEMGFQLTDSGKARALDALSQSEYYGPMPVPLEMYKVQVKRQSIRDIRLTRDMLVGSMGHLIIPDDLIDQLGPAVGSGKSVLMYGPPGNGKSSIAEGIRAAMGDTIYIPHAIAYSGQVITMYDPIVHTPIEHSGETGSALRRATTKHDTRYLLCKRPTVMTGGELMLNMLDLKYNSVSRTYQASLQLKSTGGVFIVDDLGRQEEPPQALINRWIVPLEVGYDILALQSGEKFEVPFDTLVVFSTNFHPNDIFDQAALRRIFFKVKIDGPTQDQFLKIFAMVAKKKKVPLNEEALLYLLKKKYPTVDNVYANYHAPFLCDQLRAICEFEGIPYQMRPDLIDRAWENLYVKQEKIVH
ncbi:ATPase [Rhodobacterales bacterium HKCCE3408]|nr:ATPase [Rhodobacterales bacterium HKCCE3408]